MWITYKLSGSSCRSSGNYISFKTGESETNRYEIRGFETHIDGSTEVRIQIQGQFGEEVEELYGPDGKFLEENNVVMQVWSEETRPGNVEFDGATAGTFKTTVTATDPTANNTITK